MGERRHRRVRTGTRKGRSPSPAAASALALCALLSALRAPLAADEATLDRSELPAAGKSVAHVEVEAFGRYSIAVESAAGVEIQVVDRMAGAGEIFGVAGERDGRVDLFLDRGTVRVVLRGAKLGHGTARLKARAFVELHSPPEFEAMPRLVELKPLAAELGDYEHRSYWLEIDKRRTVVFEAAGRHLADLRLWRSGSWLEPAQPLISTIEPVPGQPMTLCQLAADLEPGLYLLTAYGGAGLPWSLGEGGGAERPLHLRFGIERKGAAGRSWERASAFGFDRFVMPASADYFRLETPEAKPFSLEVAPFDAARPLAVPPGLLGDALAAHARIDRVEIVKESVPPVAELRRAAGAARHFVLVTVRGAPGEPYALERFAESKRIPIPGGGDYWLGSLHAGATGDAIDATGVLVAQPRSEGERPRVVASSAIALGRSSSWVRRFNLLDTATAHLAIEEAGEYEVTTAGVTAEVRLEPFLVSTPDGYRAPPLRRAPTSFPLDPGLYLLTLVPLEPGIVELALRHRSLPDPLLDSQGATAENASSGSAVGDTARRGSAWNPIVQLGRQRLEPKRSYELWLNEQPGVATGGLLRRLPLDLADPLPIALLPGAELELPVRAMERGQFVATHELGQRLELSSDGSLWSDTLQVEAGELSIFVRSASESTVSALVTFTPDSRLPSSPLPTLSAAAHAKLPTFPSLRAGAPRFLDLERRQAATFDVDAGEAGLYVVESSGLLATEGALRTRVLPQLVAAEENGVGRNAALRAYLREGLYQATFRTRGESAGHLGVELRRATLVDGGKLPLGLAARAEVAPDEALAYTFEIAQEGELRLRSFGLRGPLEGRLEDLDGWPVDAPVSIGDRTVRLEPGRYRWIVLPRAVGFRALTRLEAVPAPAVLAGHGPHPLPLDEERENLWLEPTEGAVREPDVWSFSLPAPAELSVALTDEMQGEIIRQVAGHRDVVAFVPPGRALRARFEAGDYRLESVSSRVNSRVRYRAAVRPTELVTGVERRLDLPAVVSLSIGVENLVELDSFGEIDVRARLYDARGRLIASGDDRPGDWNFLLAERLEAGAYRLEVEPVGAEGGETTVALRTRKVRDENPLQIPAARQLQLGEPIVVFPLMLPQESDVVAVGARAERALGLVLEAQRENGWRPIASAFGAEAVVLAPLDIAERNVLRVRVWSLDRHPTEVRLSGFAGPLHRVSEQQLEIGAALQPLPTVEPAIAALAVPLDASGCFALERQDETLELLQASGTGKAFAPATGTLVAPARTLWLAARVETGHRPRVAARRLFLRDDGEPVSIVMPPGEPIVCDVASGSGALAATVTTLVGDPWLRFVEPTVRVDRWALPARHAALTMTPARESPRLELGHGESRLLEARVEVVRLMSLDGRNAGSPFETELPPRSVQSIVLSAGGGAVRLTLGRGAAAYVAGALPEAALWAAHRDATTSVGTTERNFSVFNPTDVAVRVRLESLPGGSPEQHVVAPAHPFERRFERREQLRVDIPRGLPAAATLRIRGAEDAVLVDADGTVLRGRDLPLPSVGGSLWIEGGPGFVAAWIESDADPRYDWGHSDLASFGFSGGVASETIALPMRRELADRTARWSFSLGAPSLLVVRGASPVALALLAGGSQPRFEIFPEGASFEALVPAGVSELGVRALGGDALSGTVEISALPLEPLAEGLGEPTLMAPGETRAYAFDVSRRGPVGVGVAAADRGVETIVFAPGGRELGRGVVQWLDLEPGRYALALVAARDGAPGIVRAALVGASPPGTGPPPEVVRELLARSGERATETSAVAGYEGVARYRPEIGSEESSREREEPCYDEDGEPCYSEDPEGELE